MTTGARVLVTGGAGFIGMHVVQRLLARGDHVLAMDNFSPYYDVSLKRARVAALPVSSALEFVEGDVADAALVARLFAQWRPDAVVHLAAQPGVRYSLEHPDAYVSANVAGFLQVLEGCRHSKVRHLVYASSSSVYGATTVQPFSVDAPTDHPVSLYAATKRANELMAHTYSHLFHFPVTGLRFFTVYGPWGRPDMSAWLFTKAMLDGTPIRVFNHGQMRRDFTYVDDIAEGVVRVLDRIPGPLSVPGVSSQAHAALYNIGNSAPVPLLEFIAALERATGTRATLDLQPMQPGDVVETFADVSALERDVGFRPATPIDEGLRRFVAWYRDYHQQPSAP
jgi:UDP-glucuronate 4-epimerase